MHDFPISGLYKITADAAMDPTALDYFRESARRDLKAKAEAAERVIVGEFRETWVLKNELQHGATDDSPEAPWQPGEAVDKTKIVVYRVRANTAPA